MKKQALFFTLILSFFFISCSSDVKDRSASDSLSAFMKDNKSVVVFGKINAKDILVKADYESIPKAAVLIKSELAQYEAALDLSQGICFALEGPFEKDGNPSKLIAFVKVKNQDSLISKVTSLGLMMTEEKDLKYVQENDVTIGIKENLAIFITKKGKYDGKSLLIEAFEKSTKDLSEGKTDKILAQKADILMGVNFQNLYATSNTSLSELSPDKKKEFEALVNDSYIQSTILFEDGQAVFETKNLFSDALMNRMFFKEDPQASILSKLGTGNARLGMSLNLDMSKMENFMDDFAPDFKKSITKINFQMQLAMSTLGSKPFTNLLDGRIGMVMIGDMMRDGSLIPEANIYVGLGNKGKDINEMIAAFLPKDNAMYGMNIKMSDKEISISSGKSTSTKLNLPQFAAEFGKKGFSAFVNFDGMDMKSLGLRDGAKALYAIQNIMITADNSGSKMIIKGKIANQNILKQVIDVYVKDLEDKIGKIN